jgi:phenylacetate-CoA ligase
LVAREMLTLQQQLSRNERVPRETVRQHQFRMLKSLAHFAHATTPYYQRIDMGLLARAATLEEALQALPILERAQLVDGADALRARQLPQGYTVVGHKRSSGTSGQPIEVLSTNIDARWQAALTFRAQLWAKRDFAGSIAVIRHQRGNKEAGDEGDDLPSWGAAAAFPVPTGRSYHLSTRASLEQQWDWLGRKRPDYLMTYPSIVRAFAARAARDGSGPCRLRGITTVGETVGDDLRDLATEFLGADIHDTYSCEEIGVVAVQCSECRRYHAMDDAVIVEIVDRDGNPCRPGEVGRILVTPLLGYATPLLRYDIGDLAEASDGCTCGRHLTTLNRIAGRVRNIFKRRDGTTFWPSFGTRSKAFPKVRQYQFRQLDYDTLEVVLAVAAPLTPAEEDDARRIILSRLPAPIGVRFTYVDHIDRTPGGKYEEFVCLINSA